MRPEIFAVTQLVAAGGGGLIPRKYKPDGKLCWSVGAGTYLGEYVSVGLYYTGLGNHRIEYTRKVVSPDQDFSAQKRNIGELGLRVGFHF